MTEDLTAHEGRARAGRRRGSYRAPDVTATVHMAGDAELLELILDQNPHVTSKLFTEVALTHGHVVTEEEAEIRMRKLTQRGWLNMGVYRDETGAFVEYRWVRA